MLENDKFINCEYTDEYEVYTKNGWKDFKGIGKTKEFDVYKICLDNKIELLCADDHLVETNQGFVNVKDLTLNLKILTNKDYVDIISIENLNYKENMYDLLDVEECTYFTNGISSHNSTTVAAYALWYALFNDLKFIGIVSNKAASAAEILYRMKEMYKDIPLWLKPGVFEYNKNSIEFENKTRIQCAATSATSFRGRSINLLICFSGNNIIRIKNKKTKEEFDISFNDLKNLL